MQFFYHKDSGSESIVLDSKDSHYLFRVHRFKQGSILLTSNLRDMWLCEYKHEQKNTFKRIATRKIQQITAEAHIILAVIDIKDIYEILPMLNALNIASLQLFYADFSQKNRKIDTQKAQRILQYSCMQCGRMQPMQLFIHKDLESVCTLFPNAVAIDFLPTKKHKDSNNPICSSMENRHMSFENLTQTTRQDISKNGIIIGCEGGFSARERDVLSQKAFALQNPFILTAHLASVYIASLCV